MDFVAGEILLIDKPLTWTSFQAVNKIRHHLKRKTGVKKIKVGHAGTLDPLATGLLIICTGKKTKEIDSLMGLDKTYTGTIRLGATTPSFDLETEINQTFELNHVSEEMLVVAAKHLTGEYDQMPPVFSAKRVDGKRAYDLARAGKDVNLKPKKILVSEFLITSFALPDVHFKITCSKGTYIRSIANDFGHILKCGGHLTALRRTAIGEFLVENALTPEVFVDSLTENSD